MKREKFLSGFFYAIIVISALGLIAIGLRIFTGSDNVDKFSLAFVFVGIVAVIFKIYKDKLK